MNGLLKTLRELGREVEDVAGGKLNYGGCGVYAAAVAKRLEAMGLPVECVTPAIGWDPGRTVEKARSNLRNNGNEPTSATARDWWGAGLSGYHVGVRFKYQGRWYTHDSQTLRRGRRICGDDLEFECMPDGLTPDEAWAMADKPEGWNSTFPRRTIPAIRELVAEVLR